jgi:hypothetical protein
MEVAEAGIDRSTTPGFQTVKAHVIQYGSNWEHLGRRHPRSRHRLMAVTQHRVIKENWLHKA